MYKTTLNEYLLQLQNHKWKHLVVVQIAQDSQNSPIKGGDNTFPISNMDKQGR